MSLRVSAAQLVPPAGENIIPVPKPGWGLQDDGDFGFSLKNQYVVTTMDPASNITKQTSYLTTFVHFALTAACL